jgi:glycosyltransferase involved in cell wall biosynthesis
MAPVSVALHVGQLRQRVPGGIGRYVQTLLGTLPAAGTRLVPFAAGPWPAVAGPCPPGYLDLGPPRDALRYECWHRLRRPRLPASLDADVVHAPSLAVPPAGHRPLVVTVHDVAFLRTPEHFTRRGIGFHRRGLALARREAARVIVASAHTRGELVREGFDPGRIAVVPHGVVVPPPPDATEIEARLRSVRVEPPFVLAVGTIEPRKGVDTLVAAMARRRARDRRTRLVLVGPRGWLSVDGLDAPGVRELGRVDDDVLDALYRTAAVVAVPSRYEGFGLPALEAMARGTPVVASDTSSLPEVVGDGGVLVPPDDPDAWAAALDRLLADPERRAELAGAARARAARFTLEDQVAGHQEAYAAAAGARAPS